MREPPSLVVSRAPASPRDPVSACGGNVVLDKGPRPARATRPTLDQLKSCLLLIGVAAVGCDKVVDSFSSERVTRLEQRVAALEDGRRESEAHKRTQMDERRRCLQEAEAAYWSYIRLNGRMIKALGPDNPEGPTYRADNRTWDTAAKNKANAIEECKARWE